MSTNPFDGPAEDAKRVATATEVRETALRAEVAVLQTKLREVMQDRAKLATASNAAVIVAASSGDAWFWRRLRREIAQDTTRCDFGVPEDVIERTTVLDRASVGQLCTEWEYMAGTRIDGAGCAAALRALLEGEQR